MSFSVDDNLCERSRFPDQNHVTVPIFEKDKTGRYDTPIVAPMHAHSKRYKTGRRFVGEDIILPFYVAVSMAFFGRMCGVHSYIVDGNLRVHFSGG